MPYTLHMELNPYQSPLAAEPRPGLRSNLARRVLSAFGFTWAAVCLLMLGAFAAKAAWKARSAPLSAEDLKPALGSLVLGAGFLVFGWWIRRPLRQAPGQDQHSDTSALAVFMFAVLAIVALFAAVLAVALVAPGGWVGPLTVAIGLLIAMGVGMVRFWQQRRSVEANPAVHPHGAGDANGADSLYNGAELVPTGETFHGQTPSQTEESQPRQAAGQ